MEPILGEPAPSFPMTARDALLYLLLTHDGAAVPGDPTTVRDTAERYLRARPDDAEIRDAYEGLRTRGTPGA